MPEFNGWLLDLFEDPREGLVLYFMAENGVRWRLTQAFPVTFYALGSDAQLRALWQHLSGRADGVSLSRTQRMDVFKRRQVTAMGIKVQNPYEVSKVFHRIAAGFPNLEYADADLQIYAEARLRSARVDMDRVRFVQAPYNDTWLRDSGPICLRGQDGFKLMDFRFTGWGGKYQASLDDQLVGTLAGAGVFRDDYVQSVDFALEGGAIETDGRGTLLTTWRCLHERHPDASREQITQVL